jgi:hypothetical protein
MVFSSSYLYFIVPVLSVLAYGFVKYIVCVNKNYMCIVCVNNHSIKGSLSKDPMLMFGGRQVVDTEHVHYYGNSLGGIIGDVYMAVTTDVIRGVLGVPGGPFPLLLPRSKDFDVFEDVMRALYPDPVDYITGIGFIGLLWSRLEPSGYMSYVTENPLPNTPTHRVNYDIMIT